MDQEKDEDRVHLLKVLPEEIWNFIGDFVTDFRVFQNFRNSSPYFASTFAVNSFLERPSLQVPSRYMGDPISRLIQYPPRHTNGAFTTFSSKETIQSFNDNLQQQKQIDNPFPGHTVFISLGKGCTIHGLDVNSVRCSDNLASILKKWGDKVWYVSFRMHDPCSLTYRHFCKFMRTMPNLKALRIMVCRKTTREPIFGDADNKIFPHYTELKYVKSFDVRDFVWERFTETNSELNYIDRTTPKELTRYKSDLETTNLYDQVLREWKQR